MTATDTIVHEPKVVVDQPGSRAMPPWEVGDLPDAPRLTLKSWVLLLGPGLVLGGAAIGGGEWLAGPLTTARYGGAILWLATLSILAQVVYNLEISRYTLYCGEPIFTGKFRLLPGPLETAVRDRGKGMLIRMALGTTTPELSDPAIAALNGLKEGQYAWSGSNQVMCEVVAEHPILGPANKVGQQIAFRANGPYGVVNGQMLVKLLDMSDVGVLGRDADRNRTDIVMAPVYVATFGKGKIVGCSYACNPPTPAQLNRPNDNFTPRAIKWLAGKL